MFYVYILRSLRDEKLYTGYTGNLKRRIQEHFRGDVHTTHRMGELQLIYFEGFINKLDAQERERYLKTTKGKRTLKIMMKHTMARSSIG